MPSTAANGKINASMTSSKPTSTFNICDILDLNKKNSKKDSDDDDVIKIDHQDKIENHSGDEEILDDEKPENLSDKSEENINGLSEDEPENEENKIKMHSHSESSASHTESSQDSPLKEMNKKSRKYSKSENNSTQNHQTTTSLLSETLHQYPHLFQNHPAMRPWFNTNGKFSAIFN